MPRSRRAATSRRGFLRAAALAAAGSLLPFRPRARAAGANGDVRVAVIGLNGRGQAHIAGFRQLPGVRLVALCDADSAVLGKSAERLRREGLAIETFADARKLLERPDVDAVSIATPNHWHSLLGIWACQAGKDAYVEKPVSHNIWEGRQLVAAAARYGRIVQAGTQIRSSEGIAEAVAWVAAGNLGKITASRGLCYKRRPSIGRTEGPQPVPPTVDYDLWLGPAPWAPPRRKRFHYDWHWFWPTGEGDLGNQGIHQVDLARWFLGEPVMAPRILSVGGRCGYIDDGETPNTLVSVYDYPTAPLIFEVRGLPTAAGSEAMDRYRGASIGLVVQCEGGSVVVPDYSSARAFDSAGRPVRSFAGASSHFGNFIDCVRSRKADALKGPIAEGHISSGLRHLGNISYRRGRSCRPPELLEKIKGDASLSEACGRMCEHLAANGVDPAKAPLSLGSPLLFDPLAERFIDDAAADAFLSRAYRAPYVVPRLA